MLELSDNLLGENMTTNKSTEPPLIARRKQTTKYMFMFRRQNTWQNHNIKIANKYFKKCRKVKFLGITTKRIQLHLQKNYGQIKFRERLLPLRKPLKHSAYYRNTCFKIKNLCILPTGYIYDFRITVRIYTLLFL
jgi:hypothetical protein